MTAATRAAANVVQGLVQVLGQVPVQGWSSAGMTTVSRSASRRGRWLQGRLTRRSGAFPRSRKDLNGAEMPGMSDSTVVNAGRVEVSAQTSVQLRVEGVRACSGRNLANRGREAVPGRHFFGSGTRIGNLTGKVTGNPEAHDRSEKSAVAKPVLDRQSLSVMGTEEFSWMRTGQGEVSRFVSHTGLRDAHRSKRRLS